jgi:RNA polymerase sigma factor (sigma-70 family)
MVGNFCLLSERSLDDLIAEAQASPGNDTAAMAELIRRFTSDVNYVAGTVCGEWHLRQDAAQGARLALIQAVRNHTPGTAGFKSYARRYMRGEALRVVERMALPAHVTITDPTEFTEYNQCAVYEAVTAPFSFDAVMAALSHEQAAVAHARYVGGERLTDIAQALGVSVAAVSQRLKTIHKILRPVVLEAVAA